MHQEGIRVILDGVFNHCGINHPFFQDVIEKEKASPYRDWFEVEGFPIISDPLNYQTCGGCYYLPKFNFDCASVQEYLLDAARYWTVEYHIDGWRLDSAQRVPPTFWKSFQAEMRRLNPNIFLSAELWHDASQWFNAGIFDSASNYPLREVLFDFLLHEPSTARIFCMRFSGFTHCWEKMPIACSTCWDAMIHRALPPFLKGKRHGTPLPYYCSSACPESRIFTMGMRSGYRVQTTLAADTQCHGTKKNGI
jgi:hypothetical protein